MKDQEVTPGTGARPSVGTDARASVSGVEAAEAVLREALRVEPSPDLLRRARGVALPRRVSLLPAGAVLASASAVLVLGLWSANLLPSPARNGAQGARRAAADREIERPLPEGRRAPDVGAERERSAQAVTEPALSRAAQGRPRSAPRPPTGVSSEVLVDAREALVLARIAASGWPPHTVFPGPPSDGPLAEPPPLELAALALVPLRLPPLVEPAPLARTDS